MQSNLPTRFLAAVVPLLVIALIAGAAGYFTKTSEVAPVPPLAAAEAGPEGLSGTIQSVSGNELRIAAADGTSQTLQLVPDARIEVLTPITAAQLMQGDWINGGAFPHAESVLALTGLVVIPNPVLESR